MSVRTNVAKRAKIQPSCEEISSATQSQPQCPNNNHLHGECRHYTQLEFPATFAIFALALPWVRESLQNRQCLRTLCVSLHVCFVWLFGRETRLGGCTGKLHVCCPCICTALHVLLRNGASGARYVIVCVRVCVPCVFHFACYDRHVSYVLWERVCVRVCSCVCLRECACIHNKSFYLEGIAARALWKWKIDQYSWIYYSQHLVEVSPLVRRMYKGI